jgi:drug/metabolite transporter (DMT)-like permease
LPHLAPTPAASVQLSVPLIAAFAGAAVLGEPLTLRLLIAGVLILGGIALVVSVKTTADGHATRGSSANTD